MFEHLEGAICVVEEIQEKEVNQEEKKLKEKKLIKRRLEKNESKGWFLLCDTNVSPKSKKQTPWKATLTYKNLSADSQLQRGRHP